MSTSDTPTFGRPLPASDGTDSLSERPPSLLDELVAEIKSEVTRPPVTLTVPGRPGWAVRYRCDIEQPVLNKWRKAAADKSAPDGIDDLKFCLTILANQSDCFVKVTAEGPDGEIVGTDAVDEEGAPINFRGQWLKDNLGVGRPLDAVKSWYGVDGHILSAAYEVLQASGYGEEAERVDPTLRR